MFHSDIIHGAKHGLNTGLIVLELVELLGVVDVPDHVAVLGLGVDLRLHNIPASGELSRLLHCIYSQYFVISLLFNFLLII